VTAVYDVPVEGRSIGSYCVLDRNIDTLIRKVY